MGSDVGDMRFWFFLAIFSIYHAGRVRSRLKHKILMAEKQNFSFLGKN
jgi:hypothetical protein